MYKLLSETKINKIAMANGLFAKNLMGAAKTFEETQMAQQYIVNINGAGYAFGGDDIPERMFKSFIAATSVYLGKIKVSDPKVATALILTDVSGNFMFAGIVQYHENEENKEVAEDIEQNFQDNQEIQPEENLEEEKSEDDEYRLNFLMKSFYRFLIYQ